MLTGHISQRQSFYSNFYADHIGNSDQQLTIIEILMKRIVPSYGKQSQIKN